MILWYMTTVGCCCLARNLWGSLNGMGFGQFWSNKCGTGSTKPILLKGQANKMYKWAIVYRNGFSLKFVVMMTHFGFEVTTVLPLTWKSPYLGRTVIILRRGPGLRRWDTYILIVQEYGVGPLTNNTASASRYILIRLPWNPGPRLNIKTVFPRYGNSHVKNKTVARPYYL